MTKNKYLIRLISEKLVSTFREDGIIAGNHHFTDYWARDGYFACFGCLAIGETKIVKKMIKLFYKYQRGDGLIPYRIMRGPVTAGKYFGHPAYFSKPRPTYRLRGIGAEVLDGTTLTLLFTAILGQKGWKNAKKYLPKIKMALTYLELRERNGLLYDGPLSEWNDSILKWGNLLYSNVIYWYMLDRLCEWLKNEDDELYSNLNLKKENLAKAIRARLWNGKFFADWYDFKRRDFFNSFVNCLAIIWGFTDKKESELIIMKCKDSKIGFTIETNSPKYPWWRVDPFLRLIGMSDYQNHGLLWWQPVLAYLLALKKLRHKKEFDSFSKPVVKKVWEDKTIYECYERNGDPVKRLFYKSENPFAWSLGMFLQFLNN